MTCKIIKNQNGSPIGVADSNGNPSKIFKQISQIPFLRNFDEAVNTYTYLKGEIPTLDEVSQQLQKTGLAKKVHTLSPQQIEQELIRRGVDSNVAKQVSAWHGSPHLFNKFSTSAMGTGEGAQAFGWGLYFTDLESIARNYAKVLSNKNSYFVDDVVDFKSELRDIFNKYEFSKNFNLPSVDSIGVIDSISLDIFLEQFQKLDEDVKSDKKRLQEKDKNIKGVLPQYLSEFNKIYDNIEKKVQEYDNFIKEIKTFEEDFNFTILSTKNLYNVTLHKGKTPDQYTWLEWDKPLNKQRANELISKLTENQREQSFGYGLSGITTEGEFYKKLANALGGNLRGGDKNASLFLLENGIDGIKYPAESISRGATSDTARGFNYVVFDENAVTIEEIVQFQKAGLGLLPNGFVDLNTKEVFLNQETANLDTPIHEFSHLFTNILKQTNPQLYQRGLELIEKEGKEYIDFVKQNQPNLEGEALLEEALTQAVGEVGEKIVNKQSNFFQWLQDMWNSLKDMIGLTQYSWNEVKDMNLQQFTEAMAVDLLRGEEIQPSPILSTEQELQQIKAQAIANGTFMKAPNGKDTNLNERQWLQVRSKAFTDWFGNWLNDPQNASKVVDENGEPMVIWHGTRSEFTVFGEKQGLSQGTYLKDRQGFFFANRKEAEMYGNGVLIPVFLNIRNPNMQDVIHNLTQLDYDYISERQEAEDAGYPITRWLGEGQEDFEANDSATAYLDDNMESVVEDVDSNNNDGVIVVGADGSVTIVAFNPNQIKSATDNVGTFSAQSDDIRYQIIGEQGARNLDQAEEVSFRMDNLKVAREMEASTGLTDKDWQSTKTRVEDKRKILLATGWQKGADLKWRYEILDGKVNEIKFSEDKLVESLEDVHEYNLTELFENEEFFNAFPQTRDTKVIFFRGSQEQQDMAMATDGVNIYINKNYYGLSESNRFFSENEQRTDLLHELQHISQSIEGFQGGGNTYQHTARVREYFDQVSKANDGGVEAEVLDREYGEFLQKVINESGIIIEKDINQIANNSNLADSVANLLGLDIYHRLMGEVEARNVEKRAPMSTEDRRNTLMEETEDVLREDQIFLGVPNNASLQFRDKDGNVYNSLKEMFDNNVEDFKIGIEHEGKFVSAIEAQINPNPRTVNGLVMSLIKDGLISDKATMDTNGEILLVPTGESDLKKAITSDMARGVAKGYHGNIFKIGKDFNIRVAEQEKAKDSHDKTFQQLKREVGEEEALERKTMQEYNKFIGESNRGTTNLDFSLLPDNELVTKLLAYLNKIGVQTTSIEQYVKQYKLKNGVHPDAQALADLSNNIVAFKDGIITEAELIEEVSHFIVDAMNPQERSNMMSNIHRTREWGEYAQTYYGVYSQQGLSGQALEDAVREEILGKVLANSLKENFQRAQEQTIEGGIVSRLIEAVQEFFQRIQNFFQDSYQAELERYTFNVYENLMNETLPSEQRQRGESKLTLYSTNKVTPLQKATKSWLETLNATQRELKGKYKLSSSSNTLARQIRNLQGEINDATYKNAVADLLSVTNSQINLVDREVTRALKEGTYFPQEIKGAYESIRTSLFPIISQVKGRLGENDTQLKKEIEKTVQNISDLIDKVPQVNKKALDNVLERVFRQNNFTQEEADKYREQVENVLKSAEYDTSWFHAHLGGLLQARNPLLNLLGDVIEQMKFRERQLLQPVLKTLMSKLEASGFDILQLKKLIYKNEIINETDPDKVKKLEDSIKAKYYNQFVSEGERATEETVEDKMSEIQDEINKLTNEIENESKLFTVDEINLKQAQRTEKNLTLSQIEKAFRKDLNKQKFISMIDPKYIEDRDKFTIEVNGQIISREKGIIPGIAPEEAQVYIDEFNQLSRQIWEIKSLADGGELTKSEQKEIRDIEARRRQLMNPRQLDGTLKPGVVETWSVVKNLKDSTESKTFTYSFDPKMTYDDSTEVSIEQEAEALRIVAFQNLTLLSQKFSASQKGERNGIPQEFIDGLNSLQTEQEKWDFIMNNSTISFPQEFWDSFDPNESLVARLIALKNGDNSIEIDEVVNRIRSSQAKISNIIKSNRDFFNPAETNVEDFFQQTEVKDAQTELDKAKSDARKFFPKDAQFESSEGVDITANESYLKQLSDLGITNSGKDLSSEVNAEFNFARKHMTPRSEDAIISLRNIIKRLENKETVSKSYFTEQVIGSRTDYDNILREEIRKRLLPYYKRTEPSGYSQALEQLKQGVDNNTPNAVQNFMESGLVDVKPSNAFYDTTSRLNPEWVANRDAGREQYTSDYLKKVRNDEYFNRYNPDKNGNATTNIAEFKAREAWLEANDQAIEMNGLTGLMSRYQLPQQHKTVIRRLITSKGKPKAIGEILRDATTIREDDMELGQNIFGEKARKGDTLLTVPRYGVNKLRNQEDVSDEILHSLVWFTQQAALHKARKESISEALALRDFIINTEDYADKSNKASNTYKMADSFINANFYGVKETFSYEMDMPFLGKIDVGKIARSFNSWVRFSNLAGVTVPLTSMFQGKIQEAIEAVAKESTSPTAYKLAQNKVRKLMSGAAGEIMGFHSKSELNSKLEILGVYDMLDRFNNSALNKGWRTALAANNGLHQLGNAPVTSTAAFSIVLDYRVVDGRIMTERQYKSIFKNAKDWETYPLFDNFWKIDENGNSKIDKDGLKQALNITNEQEVDRITDDTLESISKRALALVQRVDTQIPEHQKSLASRNAIANFFLMHMNWFLVAIPNKTKFKHNNLAEGGMAQEGNWRTVLNMVSKMVQNPKQIKEIWNDAKTDDVQKRALRRFAVEASVANALAIAAIMLANSVDDDDDPAYLLTWADYMLTRVAVEQVSGTIALPQQVDEIISNPLVSYQRIKDMSEIPNLFLGNEVITQGSYAGHTTRFRAATKNLPFVRDVRRFSDFTRERQTYAYFQVEGKKLFQNYAWLSNLAVEELEDE